MSRPWTLPGAEYRKEQKMNTPAVEDFSEIRTNLERIRKEQEEATKNGIDITPKPAVEGTDAYYPSYYAQSGGTTLGLENKTLSFYEHMELLLDENDELISKYFPDPRIQRLIEKYGLKVDNESLIPYRVLPGI